MSTAQRDLASLELWEQSLARSRRRRDLTPRARREHNRRKRMSLAVAAVTMAGPGTPAAMAQVSGKAQAEVAAETPSARAIEVREGGLPLQLGSHGPLVAEVQGKLGVTADGIYGPQTDAAVRSFQARSGFVVDGIVGPITWSGLFGASSIGGSNVPPAVQQALEERLREAPAPAPAGSAPGGSAPGGSAPGASAPAPAAPAPAPGTPEPSAGGPAPAPAPDAPAPQNRCGASISTPVSGTVTSPYGPRWGRNHDGVDIAAPSGTPVRAAACGSVSVAGTQSGYGNIVCITHTSRFSTCYAHLSRFATSQGAQVRQGQVIGYVGCTGSCTGPHLHFETRIDGAPQNPSGYLRGTSMPGASTAAAKASATPKATTATSPTPSTPTAVSTGSGGAQVAPSTTPAPATPAAPAPSTTPVPATPAAPAPTAPAPTEVAPAPAPAPAPVEAAPVPVDAAPVPAEAVPAPEVAPVEAAPVAPAPVEAAPVAPAPVEAAPVEAAPVEAAPVDPAVAAPAEAVPDGATSATGGASAEAGASY